MRQVRLGVVGLGRGFMLMLPTLAADPRLKLTAAADPQAPARARFAAEFGARTYATAEELYGDGEVEAVYIATPHQFHAANAIAAAAAGKHMLIEKPMAVTLSDCAAIVAAARAARVQVVIGHSHSFDEPIAATRRLIASGEYGRLRLITAFNFTDFLYRPRRPEELDTAQGGGVIFNQGAHQIDVARFLAGGLGRSVRGAITGRWDPARPTEGAYSALLTFADGAAANLTYSGNAHFDSDEFCDWIGESGLAKNPAAYGATRLALRSAPDEATLKARLGYGAEARAASAAGPRLHEHFGVVIASCERADLRPLSSGIVIYDDESRRVHPLPPPAVPRSAVIDELYAAVISGTTPAHSGEWGMATLEVCHAILRSAAEGREINLEHQVPLAS